MKSLTFITFMVSEKIPVFKFGQAQTLDRPKNVSYLPRTHTRVTQVILCLVFLMYVTHTQNLNYSRQQSKGNLKSTFAIHISDTP